LLSQEEVSVKLTVYDQVDLFEMLQPEWNELLRRSASDRIFSTWEWQSTWWDAYHPGKLWVIVCRDEGDRLLGIAPWFVEYHPEQGRVVRSIGCIEVTDYLDLIIDKDHVDTVLNCFAVFLVSHRSDFDVIDLCNLPETSPIYTRFPAVLSQYQFDVKVSEQEVCPVIVLPTTWDNYLDSLDKKQRHEIRRKIRRVEGAVENVGWYIVGASHDLNREIERFLSLMAASHSQKAVFLQDSQNVDFFKKMVPIVYQNGWLQMSFITIGGQASAAYLNFVYGNQVLVYNSGLLPDQYGHLSPGIVLLAYNIQHAIEAGYSVFDFLRGNEVYKYRMGAEDTKVYMLRARSLN
jgi:CelD/BcsL family acetyltransferase involved in cellulose biosynthesis